MCRRAAGAGNSRYTPHLELPPVLVPDLEPLDRAQARGLLGSGKHRADPPRCTGEEHQNGYAAVPLSSNGKVDTYTYRAWGDLMAVVWSTEEDKDYGYIDFYM
jgi:hypothetical protein